MHRLETIRTFWFRFATGLNADSGLQAVEVGDFQEVNGFAGSRRAGLSGPCRRSPGVRRIAEHIRVADVRHHDVGRKGRLDPGYARVLPTDLGPPRAGGRQSGRRGISALFTERHHTDLRPVESA